MKKNAQEFIKQNMQKIEAMIHQGKTINQIIREIGFSCDVTLRRYLKDNDDKLYLMSKQNGIIRQAVQKELLVPHKRKES